MRKWLDRAETISFIAWGIGFAAGLAGWIPTPLCFALVLPAYGFMFYRRWKDG